MRLYIIGNGFDLNHGYKTKYNDFSNYISSHNYSIGDIDLSYLFNMDDYDLWNDFENNLSDYDFASQAEWICDDMNQELSDRDYEQSYYKNRDCLESFQRFPTEFQPALCRAFSDFILDAVNERAIKPKNEFIKKLTNNDIYITFNYTKTLEKLYNISSKRICYLHGIANYSSLSNDEIGTVFEEPEIVFGHGDVRKSISDDQESFDNISAPYKCLRNINKYLVKDFQYEKLKNFINPFSYSIDNIEIIGHGLGPVDEEYFRIINEYVESDTTIKYWLYNQKDFNRVDNLLKKIFSKHCVVINTIE